MLRRVAFVTTEVSEELSASIMVTRIGELGIKLAVTSVIPSSPILVIITKEALSSTEKSVLTNITRNISEDGILHSNRRGTLKSCMLR
jgi:hypothetical protein